MSFMKLSGRRLSTSSTPKPDKKTQVHIMAPGSTVNSLCVVRIWYHCVETVVSQGQVRRLDEGLNLGLIESWCYE